MSIEDDKPIFTNHMQSTRDPATANAEPLLLAKSHIVDYAGNWTEDYKYENGNYENRCIRCHNHFLGYKRRHVCKLCVDLTPRTPEDMRREINAQVQAIINQIASDLGLEIQPNVEMEEIINRYRSELGDLFHEDGTIDIIKLANRSVRYRDRSNVNGQTE